ncbi:MAG: hypothetical protein QM764_18985 [Chitinophagaceae bacterium]
MKRVAFSVLFFFLVSFSFGQSFMHGAGVGVFGLKNPGSDFTVASSLSYNPRINFVETDGFSVSAGLPIDIGFSGNYSVEYNSYYGGTEENTLQFFVAAPATVNINFGAGSTPDNESRIGFFVGGGYGLRYGKYGTTVTDPYYGETVSYKYKAAFGPSGNAGVRFAVGSNQKNIEVRLSYMKVQGKEAPDVYGVNCYFNF